MDVKQPGVWRERRRRVVGDVVIHERSGNRGVLVRIAFWLSFLVEARCAQLFTRPNFEVTRCSPVVRSSTKKYPLRVPVITSLRIRPLNGASTSTGVCVESQSCVSCGDVW